MIGQFRLTERIKSASWRTANGWPILTKALVEIESGICASLREVGSEGSDSTYKVQLYRRGKPLPGRPSVAEWVPDGEPEYLDEPRVRLLLDLDPDPEESVNGR